MKTSILALLPLLVLTSLFSCKEKEGAEGGEASTPSDSSLIFVSARQFEANGMALGSPEKRKFSGVIRVSGTIDVPPENRVVISAVYGGYVRKTTLLEGDQVQKGQVLLTLENPEFLTLQQQYLEVSEQLPYLMAEYERQEVLYGEKISSQKVYLKAQSDYKTAMARERGLEKQLGMLGIRPGDVQAGRLQSEIAIRAPISGSVNRINVRTGAYVSQATEIMEIINTDHIHLELIVFEQDINRIRIGQSIRFRVPELTTEVQQGSVYLIGSTVDENRTVKVHGNVEEDAPAGLMVGMFVQADILVPADSGTDTAIAELWSLPETAFETAEEGTYILLLEAASDTGYSFRRIPVEAGMTLEGFTAFTATGVPAEAGRVLVRGVEMLRR